jgi:hypothetical protein
LNVGPDLADRWLVLLTSARPTGRGGDQQPRQILFSFRSIILFSSAIAASLLCAAAEPVVTPAPVFGARPLDSAVPALFVPGGGEAGGDEAVGDAAPADAGPPALCAIEATGDIKITIAVTADVTDSFCIGNLLSDLTIRHRRWFRAGRLARLAHFCATDWGARQSRPPRQPCCGLQSS